MNHPNNIGKAFKTPDGVFCLSCLSLMEFEKCSTCHGQGETPVTEEDPKSMHSRHVKECDTCCGEKGEYWCPNAQCQTSYAITFVDPPGRQAQLIPAHATHPAAVSVRL